MTDLAVEKSMENGLPRIYYCTRCDRFTDVKYLFDKVKGERQKSYCYKCHNEFPLEPLYVEFTLAKEHKRIQKEIEMIEDEVRIYFYKRDEANTVKVLSWFKQLKEKVTKCQ